MYWVTTLLLTGLAALVAADLPSCERARCIHCEVEFISRMCPSACGACARPIGNTHVTPQPQRLPAVVATLPPQPPVIWQPAKQVPSVRQAGVQTQAYQQAIYQRPAQAFAAPVQSYPQASTLAPLIEQPVASQLNPQLANRPADLAQPLPEYQRQFNAYNQQPGQYNGFQNFGQPQNYNYGQQPQQQTFNYQQQQQQQSQFFNPFQPFLSTAYNQGGQNPLDPFGLFSFNQAQNGLSQTGQQTTQPARAFVPPAVPAAQAAPPMTGTAFTGNYNAGIQQVQQQQQTFQQQPQASPARPAAVQQTSQLSQQNPLQLPQMPNFFQAPQLPPSPPAPHTLSNPLLPNTQPSYVTNNQQAPTQPQQVQPKPQAQPQQPVHQQPQPVQPVQQPQPQQPLPETSNSIDAGATWYNKYVDGKGPAPAPAPAQCPRQPGWAPCISKDVANERFRNCCARLGEGCAQMCNYDATLATMQLAVLTGRCPLNKVADMMVCASGYEDATACCEAYNVFEPGYEQCRPYCNPAAGLPQGGPLSDKYKCLVKLGAIQQCFYVSQKP